MAGRRKNPRLRGDHDRSFDPVKAANFTRNLKACLDRLGMKRTDLKPYLTNRVYYSLGTPKNHFKGEAALALSRALRIQDAGDLFHKDVPPLATHLYPSVQPVEPQPAQQAPASKPAPDSLDIPDDLKLGMMLQTILLKGTSNQIAAVRAVILATFQSL